MANLNESNIMIPTEKDTFRVLILNLSGNVGKSTIASALASKLGRDHQDIKVMSIESVNNSDALNDTNLDVEEYRANQFHNLYQDLIMTDRVIVDVGSSNIVQFVEGLVKYRSAAKEFDMFIVPTVPVVKQQTDTIATIKLLCDLGIDSKKIRVVFNQYSGGDTVDRTYAHVMGYAQTDGKDMASWFPAPVINANSIFELKNGMCQSIQELAEDTTDFRAEGAKARAARDKGAQLRAAEGQILHDLALSAHENLEQAFTDLFIPWRAAT